MQHVIVVCIFGCHARDDMVHYIHGCNTLWPSVERASGATTPSGPQDRLGGISSLNRSHAAYSVYRTARAARLRHDRAGAESLARAAVRVVPGRFPPERSGGTGAWRRGGSALSCVT